jgi:hypothetical protein
VLDVYPNSLYFKEVKKINKNLESNVPFNVSFGKKTEQAIIFLSVLSILSKCDKVITNSGNVGMWLCLFRNNANGVSQYLSPKKYKSENLWLSPKNLLWL